jgi:hypothetical protein
MNHPEFQKELSRLHDRCDGCGAQAFVRVGSDYWDPAMGVVVRDLDFCAHHFKKHESSLYGQGFVVLIDDRDKINERPSVSANAE